MLNPSDDPYKNSLVGIIRNNNQDQALTQQKRHIDNSCIQIVGHSFLVINVPIYNSRSELAADNIQPGGNRSYIYSGYVQIAEIDATNEDAPQVVKTYLWDPSEPVATRVLHMTVWNNGTEVESLYYTHDLQKNVTALFGQAAGRRAQYEHDLYGNPINTTGDAAGINPYRYSSEYHDEDLDLIYYNYRHYNPTDGRWINRDYINNMDYVFCWNNTLDLYDLLGLVGIKLGPEGTSNCLGGAMTNRTDITLFPDSSIDPDKNMIEAMKKEGWDCKEIKIYSDCMCECEDEKILITVYENQDPENVGKNPWTDPTFKWNGLYLKNGRYEVYTDLHAIRGLTGCSSRYKNIHRYMHGSQKFDEIIDWDLFTDTPLLWCCKTSKKIKEA